MPLKRTAHWPDKKAGSDCPEHWEAFFVFNFFASFFFSRKRKKNIRLPSYYLDDGCQFHF
jgi:hypothetical protein